MLLIGWILIILVQFHFHLQGVGLTMTAATADVALPSPPSVRKNLLVQTLVAVLLCLAIGLYFWIDSRYPSLVKKLHTGTAIQLKGVLSFDALMPVTADMPLTTRIGHTTVNWMWTNRIGMTFGICFGAALLTLLSSFSQIRFKSAAGNTLFGAAIGTPLGVCANCVAPIGRSLFVAGASPNTVLATMVSSPLLNVVVLAMAFTLFPIQIALVRLAVPLVLLGLIPLIVGGVKPAAARFSPPAASNRWLQPAGKTLRDYLIHLGRLAATHRSSYDRGCFSRSCRC